MLKRILGTVTFSCWKITEMVESEAVTKLSIFDRIRYKTHLGVCKACRSYEKQSALIGKALSRLMSSSPQGVKPMDNLAKQKILDRISKNEK